MNSTRALHDAGQSLWVDNMSQAMLKKGTLEHYIRDLSVTGLTSNPTIFDRAISGSTDYDDRIHAATIAGKKGEELVFDLILDDLRSAADLFLPIHERTAGVDGWVSLEVSPLLAYEGEATVRAARQLRDLAGRPNLYIKIPGTPAGLFAIEESIFQGIPVNVTLLFSREQYLAAASAYMRGIERRVSAGLSPVVASVASLFVSRWDHAVVGKIPPVLANKLGIAVSARAYGAYRELLASDRWQRLANMGARPQRLLWASTSTKDKSARDVLYVESLAAPHTINTMPDATLLAFADHGTLGEVLTADSRSAERVLNAYAAAGIDVGALAEHLQREGADSFTASWQELRKSIERKEAAVTSNAERERATRPSHAP